MQERRHELREFVRPKHCLRPFVGWMARALLATQGASAGKWYGPAPSKASPTVSSGSAVLGTKATVATERNCARASPLSTGILPHTSFHRSALCCGSMANMGQEPYSLTWLASLL